MKFAKMETEQKIKKAINKHFKDTRILDLFVSAFTDTLEKTIHYNQKGNVFVLTGDIPAMWLRDSVCQVRPFLYFVKTEEKLKQLILELLNQQYQLIQLDPYANAFNEEPNGAGHQDDITEMLPEIWERKYEIDSLCYPIQLAYLLWKNGDETSQFNKEFIQAVKTVIAVWEVEQHHETKSAYRFQRTHGALSDTLIREGKGSETAYTGMLWSGFRPSDDACEYGYLIPANLFATYVLGYLKEILPLFYENESALFERISRLKSEIEAGINKCAIYRHPVYGEIYAYEVDGLGNQNLMDDANVPSLLSLPFLHREAGHSAIYKQTRAFLLSADNPYYYQGTYAKGIGSPHTPEGFIWPIGLSIQALTSTDRQEKEALLEMLLQTNAGAGMMHESFDPDDPSVFTREWFSWANMMFCEVVLDLIGYRLEH